MLITWLICRGRNRIPEEPELRRAFRSLRFKHFREKDNHSHGGAAGRRTQAKQFMHDLAVQSGLQEFQVQQSYNDQKYGIAGSRTFFWSKDMTMDYSFKLPGKRDLVLMTDVDYYINMPWFLAWTARPILMYSFVPTKLVEPDGPATHFFNADNTVEQNVRGGGHYHHQLWNYGADDCIAHWKICGIPIITTAYHIERRNVDEHHQLILISPISYSIGIYAWITNLLDGHRLERLKVADGEYCRMRVQDKDKMYVCTSKAGTYSGAKTTVEDDAAVAVIARLTKNDITPPTVQSYIGSDHNMRPPAAVVCAYHRHKTGFKAPVVYPVSYAIKDYVFKPESFIEHTKSLLTPFMSPIVDGCYAPTDTAENEQECIESRITKILTDVEMPQEFMPFVEEFLEFLIPKDEIGKSIPMTMDDVYERQNRPQQKRLIEEGSFVGPDMEAMRRVDPFVKKEAYQKANDPRNISTINSRDKIDYSCLMYAAAEILKKRAPWYAFGKAPIEIAKRVAAICCNALGFVVNSDFSRFDGRLSAAFRLLERLFLLRAFPKDMWPQIIELHGSQFNLRGRAPHGTKYDTGFSRLSGSPETALFNSLANAFAAYVSLRQSKSKTEAWASLGIYGGDDGLTADLDIPTYHRVSKELGLKTTAEEVKRKELGVKFLARLYSPEVWTGSEDSCCDLARQLSKFHATPNLPSNVTPAHKLVEKCRGFYLSDRNTPIIGELAQRVMDLSTAPMPGFSARRSRYTRLAKPGSSYFEMQMGTREELAAQTLTEEPESKILRNYASLAALDEQYPNTNETNWMQDVLLKQIPTFSTDRFRQHLAECTTLEHILQFPLCAEPVRIEVDKPVVVQDEILLPTVIQAASEALEEVIAALEPAEAPKADPPDPHLEHRWRNRDECFACHPERAAELKAKRASKPAGAKPAAPVGGAVSPTVSAPRAKQPGQPAAARADKSADQPADRPALPPSPPTTVPTRPKGVGARGGVDHRQHRFKGHSDRCHECHPELVADICPPRENRDPEPPARAADKPQARPAKPGISYAQAVKGSGPRKPPPTAPSGG